MFFNTDKQTQEDLNIYGKPGSDSIFTLYNRTQTINGGIILEKMFSQPLSEMNEINERSNLISYLAVRHINFPFRAELFDQAEQYLGNTDERTRLSPHRQPLEKAISRLVAANANDRIIYNGISALIEIIQQLKVFITFIHPAEDSPYKSHIETLEIIKLLSDGIIGSFSTAQVKGKIPYDQMILWDDELRFRQRQNMKSILRYIYHLDVYLAVAKVAAEKHFIFPEATGKETSATLVEDFYHPQLKNAVPNTVKITPDSNVFFLTGANMAGKSTFMKSLGLAMYLAHMGFPIAAKRMKFAVLDGIYTTINLADNLSVGASHFYAEVLRLKTIAQELKAGKNLFVIFDELFRGTNVKDAYEATIAITAAIAKKRSGVFIISTHIIEAGEVLKRQCASINFKYLPTRMKGNIPEYSYVLETGITADRHGMLIIKNEGILDILKRKQPSI